MSRRAGRALVALVVAIALGGVAGCSGGIRDERPVVAVFDPGTPLGEGMMVPGETHLIGPVFSRPTRGEQRSTISVLAVESDPFVLWDGIAYQAHQLGAPLPGSGICAWYETAVAPGAQPRTPVPVSEPRPEGMDRLACGASATGTGPDGEHIGVVADLVWTAEGAELGLEVTGGGPAGPPYRSPDPDPGPAPPGTAAQLPPVAAAPSPAPGEAFGPETNCFETGYDRLHLPSTARLASRGTAFLGAALVTVLAVSDPHAALDDIAGQLDPTGPDTGEGHVEVGRVGLGAGQIWQLTAEGQTGAGRCEILSSTDGTALLVLMDND